MIAEVAQFDLLREITRNPNSGSPGPRVFTPERFIKSRIFAWS
jgi:hypothetical protein